MNIIELLDYAAGILFSLVIVGIVFFMIYKLLGSLKWILIFTGMFIVLALFNNYPTFTIILGSVIIVLTIMPKFFSEMR
jgi:hypothetical protein